MVHAILGVYATAKAERALSHSHEPSEARTKMKKQARHVLAGVLLARTGRGSERVVCSG
jgi:hypothetical protein